MYFRNRKTYFILTASVIFIVFTLFFIRYRLTQPSGLSLYARVEMNYGRDIELASKKFNLPSEYLKSLIILESSGSKEVSSRFESHVFNALVSLRSRKRKEYKKLKPHHLKGANDAALRNLSSSWGPFQIMGYKCLELGVKVSDLRGDSAVYWGAYWINEEYGNYLRKNRFSEAFRIHNTGSPTGKTYHSEYVAKGLKHINHFMNTRN